MIKAVIFDMDGVLIDSVELGLRMRKKQLTQHGVDLDTIPDPEGEDHRAASLKTLLANVKTHTGVSIDHDEFAKVSRANLRRNMQEYRISVDPNLIAFLDNLKRHGIVCAIASSSLRGGFEIKLDMLGIKKYFSVIVTGSDVDEHKPHPEPYLYTLKKLGLSAKDCVIFEDSLTGVQAGNAAGCKVIGFTQYNPSKQPLPGTIATVESWSKIDYEELTRLLSTGN